MTAQSKIEATGLYAALAKAQAKLTAPSKNREVSVKMKSGRSYKFKYATLDHLIEHVRGPLTENGLWFVQMTEPGQMVTRIVHESGEYVDCAVPMPNLPNAPQEAGSILTYFRRYSLAVALGLASDEDDDANVAEGNGYDAKEKAAPSQMPDAEWAKLVQLIEATNTNQGRLLKNYGVNDLRYLSQDQYAEAVSVLEDRLAKLAKAETNNKAKEPV